MPETVSKFTRVLAQLRGTAASNVPVAYDLTCDCGARATGTRSTTWKQHICSDCHAELYVLPANVYPRTPGVPSEVIGGSFVRRLSGVISDQLPGAKRTKSRPKVRSAERPESAESGSETTGRRFSLPKISIPRIDVVGFLRRTCTPFRLVMLAMAIVVGGTSWWIWQQNNLEAARQAWRESLDQIPALLAEDDIDSLSGVLQTAVDAGITLDRDGQEWREVSNLFLETQAVLDVSHATLPTLLLEACDRNGQLQNTRLDTLRSNLKDVAFVMDGFIDPDGSGTAAYTIDVPVIPGTRPVQVRLQMPGLNEFMEQSESGQIVFAFRCADVTTAGDSDYDAVILEVDPQSFVLITREAHCRRLGFPVDEDAALQQRLATQLAFVRESDSWSQRQSLFSEDSEEGETP